MTQPILQYAATGPESAGGLRPEPRDWRNCLLATAILAAMCLLVHNSYWVPGPDTSFYIGAGRSLAQGEEGRWFNYVFNGNAIARTPPGWPLVLAGAMKISASFAFLNLLPKLCIVLSAAMAYWIVRRMASPKQAFWITLIAGTSYWWYTSAMQLRSEALFTVCFTLAVLAACWVSEGKASAWRIAVLALACLGMIEARYAGLPGYLVVAGVLLSGRKRKWDRAWTALLVSGLLTVGTFFGTRYVLQEVLPKRVPPTAEVVAGSKSLDNFGSSDSDEGPPMVSLLARKGVSLYFVQGMGAGKWLCGVIWMPMHLAVASPALGVVVNLFGWFLLAFYAACMVAMAKRRQWILLGAALYCAAIIARWGVVNPRYLMPVTPLIVAGLWIGFLQAAGWAKSKALAGFFRLGVPLLVVTALLCNVGLYAVDAWIARSGQFYERSLGGEVHELVAAAHMLSAMDIRDGDVAVNQNYVNLNRTRPNGFGLRGLVMLTDRGIRVLPNRAGLERKKPVRVAATQPTTRRTARQQEAAEKKRQWQAIVERLGDGNPNNPQLTEALLDYAEFTKARYYLYRPPVSPWRAWHFRVPWLQRWVTKVEQVPTNAGWEMYRFEKDGLRKVGFPSIEGWPTRVPGL